MEYIRATNGNEMQYVTHCLVYLLRRKTSLKIEKKTFQKKNTKKTRSLERVNFVVYCLEYKYTLDDVHIYY